MQSAKFSVETVFTLALTPTLSPRERVCISASLDNGCTPVVVSDSVLSAASREAIWHFRNDQNAANILPLLGERVGVREGVIADFMVTLKSLFRFLFS